MNDNVTNASYLNVRIFGRSALAGTNLGQEPPVREIGRAQSSQRAQSNNAYAVENLAD